MVVKRTFANRITGYEKTKRDIPQFTERIEKRTITFQRKDGISVIALEKAGQNYIFVYNRKTARKVLVKIGYMAARDSSNPYYPDFDLDDTACLEKIIRNCYEM